MELNSFLKIGEVNEVQGKTIKAIVYSNRNTEYLNYNGSVLKNIGIGSFVLIRKGFSNIIGKVEGEYTKENASGEKYYSQMGDAIHRIVSISILGGIQSEKFVHGLTELPLIGNFVYILEDSIISKIFAANTSSHSISLGKIVGHDDYPFKIGVQEIASSHIGIFGNTGSGKSNTLAKLYKELIDCFSNYQSFKKNSKFIILDFNGEYATVFSESSLFNLSTRIHSDVGKNTSETEFSTYPIALDDLMNEDHWAIILEATDKTQKPFIRRTIKTFSRIRSGQEEFSIDSLCELIIKTQSKYTELKYTISDIFDSFGLKSEFDELDTYVSYNAQAKQFHVGNNYNISADYIRNVLFNESSINSEEIKKLPLFALFEFAIKYNYWLEISRSYITKEHIAPLIARATVRCDDMAKVFEILESQEYSQRYLKLKNIEVISLLNLNLAMKKIVPMIICKVKYNEKKITRKNELNSTLHFVIDEAHNILSDMSTRESEEWKDYRLESFEEIIKEGRKFGVFLTIASQRPSDISDTIISQLHNYFIHRLVNEEDLRKISKTVAFVDKSSNEMIPILPAGGCLVSGLAVNFPVLVQIDRLPSMYRPKSENIDITRAWTKLK